MKFKDSALAHYYLDNLTGIEIGGSAHNSFNLPNCKNIDYTDRMDTVFKKNEVELCGEAMPVDIVANGDELPLEDESVDYVISSHVIEHFFDPIKAIKEWLRVIKKGGYIFIIAPTRDALTDKDGNKLEHRPCTKLEELIKRHTGEMKEEDVNMNLGHQTSTVSGLSLHEEGHGHWSVWNIEDFLPICEYLKLNVIEKHARDDKVGNGFCVVIKK